MSSVSKSNQLNRRTFLQAIGGAAGVAFFAGCAPQAAAPAPAAPSGPAPI